MTFENDRTIIRIRLTTFISTVFYVICIFLIFFAEVIDFPLLGISKISWTILLSAMYFVISFGPQLLHYTYLYFSDDGDKLVFRYYRVGIMRGRRQSVEIPKSSFAGYKYEKTMGHFLSRLVIYQRIQEGVAKYPPIPLNSLRKKEKRRIMSVLSRYSGK
jgi:uncharacterized membrane protein (DUF485 family)